MFFLNLIFTCTSIFFLPWERILTFNLWTQILSKRDMYIGSKNYNESAITLIYVCSKDFRIIITTTANQSKIALKKDLHLIDLSGRLFEVLCFRVHTAVGTDIVISPFWFLDHAPNKTKNPKLHIYFFHLITRPKPLIFIFLNAKLGN